MELFERSEILRMLPGPSPRYEYHLSDSDRPGRLYIHSQFFIILSLTNRNNSVLFGGKIHMATWDLSNMKHHIFICNGSSCNRAGAEELTQVIRQEISDRELDDFIHTTRTRCNGRCQDKCVVIHYPKGTWYKDLKPEDVPLLIDSLCTNEDYKEKASHLYDGQRFERSSGVISGVPKEKVIKVSKKF